MRAVLLGLGSAGLFALATPASKALLRDLTPFQLAGFLYLGAAAAMVPVMVAPTLGGPRVRLFRLDVRNRRRLGGAVVAGGLVAPVLLLAGLRLADATSVALLLNLEVAATAVLGARVFHEPLGWRARCGVAGIVAAGAFLAGWDWPGVAAALLVAAACVGWALDNHLTALVDGVTPAVSTFWKGAVAGSVNLVLGLALTPLVAPGSEVVAALAVGAVAYGASIAAYIRSAQQLGAVRAQALFATAPFLAAALSCALLGETLDARTLAAATSMAVSTWLLFGGMHVHTHRHAPMEHVHEHRHDDGHHDHVHPGLPPSTRHAHLHRHAEVEHAHPHWPDLHHRHEH